MEQISQNHRWKVLVILFTLFIITIAVSWYLSSKTSAESNSESKVVANYIKSIVEKNFPPINPDDTFWKFNLNLILRKIAHFMEYIVIGAAACLFFNVLLRRVWFAALTSVVLCPVLAYIDEYRQLFTGRTARWFDVKVDSSGALVGILIMTIIFLVISYVMKLKARIRELEGS